MALLRLAPELKWAIAGCYNGSMTTINNITDLACILREEPEWAEPIRSLLLSQELLELPNRFAEFVQLTNRSLELVYKRLDNIEPIWPKLRRT